MGVYIAAQVRFTDVDLLLGRIGARFGRTWVIDESAQRTITAWMAETSYAEAARVLGCNGIRVEEAGQLADAPTRDFAKGPTVVDVVITRDPAKMLPGVDSRVRRSRRVIGWPEVGRPRDVTARVIILPQHARQGHFLLGPPRLEQVRNTRCGGKVWSSVRIAATGLLVWITSQEGSKTRIDAWPRIGKRFSSQHRTSTGASLPETPDEANRRGISRA